MERLIHRVRGLVERGERISPEDCRQLFDVRDLNRLSQLSRIARERRYGRDAHFTVAAPVPLDRPGQELEPLVRENDEGNGVVLNPTPSPNVEKIGDWVRELIEGFSSIPGAALRLDPRLIHEAVGQGGLGDLLQGVDTSRLLVGPGGAFSDDPLWGDPNVVMSAERWLAIHSSAQSAGVATDAGVHYHDDADPDQLVAFLSTLRDLQEKSGGFRSIVSLPFTVAGYEEEPHRCHPTAAMTLRITAILRLFFDQILHVATPVRLLDPELSFVTLSYGADLIDPLVAPEEGLVARRNSAILPIISPSEKRAEDDLLRLIEERIVEARFRPVPVDARLHRLRLVEADTES